MLTKVCFLLTFSLNWQHQLCKNPRPNPDIKTLFTDHSCAAPTNGARAPPPANGPLVGSIPKSAGFPPMGAHAVSIATSRHFTYPNHQLLGCAVLEAGIFSIFKKKTINHL